MIPTVAIVGRPNVGKSTLFNRIVGERKAITDDAPGITRDRIYGKATWLTKEFNIIDTGGIDFDDTPFTHSIKSQAEIAINEADFILFVCDINVGLTNADLTIAKMLYKSDTSVVVALNKADNLSRAENKYEFYSLGLGDPIPVSSQHGTGVADLLDHLIHNLKPKEDVTYEEDRIKLCLIGRPNVGKSSLMNSLLGEERVIVSDIKGTTRDSVDSLFTHNEQDYVVIDTAGLRKKGKVYENAEKYSVFRALSAIERSDIALILIDAETGIREQDKRIAGYAVDENKAVIIVVNKWDTISNDSNTYKYWDTLIRSHFKFIPYAPIIYLSALTKKRVHTLFPAITTAFKNYTKRVQTSVLNDVIMDAMYINPPKEHKGAKLNVFYATQVAIRPPTFVLFVNDENCMHFTYERYIKNRIRDAFGLEGSPMKIILRKRD
ncbi:MAG: ribosome biogenesis GTPase Der [Candidatus Izimaplasma sp.]|nr:ribosome biogenesis GTPase Der [Candidatus Izimaplasma bacterium]